MACMLESNADSRVAISGHYAICNVCQLETAVCDLVQAVKDLQQRQYQRVLLYLHATQWRLQRQQSLRCLILIAAKLCA